jgi:hypothetical protein
MTPRKSLSLSQRLMRIANRQRRYAQRFLQAQSLRLTSMRRFKCLSITSVLASTLLLLSIPTMASNGLAFQSQSLQQKAQTNSRSLGHVMGCEIGRGSFLAARAGKGKA